MNRKTKHPSTAKPCTSGTTVSVDTPVQFVKGVGPARAKLFHRIGIDTIGDILYYFPWRYEDRRNLKKLNELVYGHHETTIVEVISSKVLTTPRKKMQIFELSLKDGTGYLKAKWFNQPYLTRYFRKNQKVIMSGIVKGNPYAMAGLEMENPDFELIGSDEPRIHTSRIIPVYKATEGISPKQIRTLMFHILGTHSSLIQEFMPEEIMGMCKLKPLQWAVKEAHFPEACNDINALNRREDPAHTRLVFDEFFLLELGLALLKKREAGEEGISFESSGKLTDIFFQSLPFTITDAQERVFTEIKKDMQRSLPMNRLIHGDVGCGKTVVAIASMLIAIENGYQACLMAPTEVLAEQHYINIHGMVEELGLKVVLLTSGRKEKPLDEIADGKAQIVIGTHSLIQERVTFKKLGLAIIDEQHRFGVVQRAHLRHKGFNPDILIMTATPIPRTLALTLYGDLDISIIDELPSGRKPIKTKVLFPAQKEDILALIEREISKGRQAYVVYPLIEESEKLDLKSANDGAESFRNIFPQRSVGLIHGRMPREEREEVMSSFKEGNIDILVSTTVIEVGIDVPNASLMLIVHAERFGLAQLHQLRGRIGRGSYDSYCLLLAYHPLSEEAKKRLKAMESTCDGFKIAEEDLGIRGPGDFFGTRQSGLPDLIIADIIRDIRILEKSRKEAFALVDSDPELKNHPRLKQALHKKWIGRLELIKS